LPDMDLDPIINAFITMRTLKWVSLELTTFAQIQVLADVLGSPNCNITEMEIGYRNHRNPNIGQLEREQLTQTLVNSLQRNSSLRTLNFHVWNGELDFDWPSVSNLLCNTSSIDATIHQITRWSPLSCRNMLANSSYTASTWTETQTNSQ
jgi:hypothetical protein